LLKNSSTRGHWIRIKTVGTRSNRDGYGARVEISAGGVAQEAEVRANCSYLSASDARVHFGLGEAAKVDSIIVRWPSGTVDTIRNETADQDLVVREGAGVVQRVPAPKPSGAAKSGAKKRPR